MRGHDGRTTKYNLLEIRRNALHDTLKSPISEKMKQLLILLLFFVTTAAHGLEMRDAIVRVELHDRSGRVFPGNGMFISGLGEFAVLKSIVEPARKDPYKYTMSFKTADGVPLSDIQFSHCDKDDEKGFCFYKANYVPYRKIDLEQAAKPFKEETLLYHRQEKGIAGSKIEGHPDPNYAWSTASNKEGRTPGTLLLDKEGKPMGVVTDKKLRNSNLVIPLSDVKKGMGGGQGYFPVEQQSNNSLPRELNNAEANMARMVGDTARMSEEQIKKALDALFVPQKSSIRAGLNSRQDNNMLRKNRKEEVLVQEAARGDEQRKEFFEKEKQALEADQKLKAQENEMGELEKKLAMKEKLMGAMQMKIERLNSKIAEGQVQLEIHGESMTEGAKQEVKQELAGNSAKLDQARDKAKGLADEIHELKQKLGGVKGELETQKLVAQKLLQEAKESAEKNAGAIQGANTIKGDLL